MNATFEEKASILIARLEFLNITHRKKESSPRFSNIGGDSPITASKKKQPKLQPPSCTGSYTWWTFFTYRFRASVDSNRQLTHSEKLYSIRS